MIYQCLDCTYKGKHFPDGVCPGCGSAWIKKLEADTEKKPIARKPYRLVLALALWVYLVIEIYGKFT